jgi:ribosomal protein S12 methylthiotransferase
MTSSERNRRLPSPPVRVGMISLGCAKNLVDAEIMLGSLLKDGIEITNDPAAADAVIINTCSFIDAAQEESVDTILESTAVRDAQRRGQAVIVSGCLTQRFRDELPRLFPEVDAFMGIDQVPRVAALVREALGRRAARSVLVAGGSPKSEVRSPKSRIARRLTELDGASSAIGGRRWANTNPPSSPLPLLDIHARPTYIPDYATPRFRLTPRHFAYLKIAEGCNHPCSFCIIPRMRGSHRSRPPGDLLEEARRLVAEGVRELNLISQDSTYYGLDRRPNHSRAIASPRRFRAAASALPADAPTLARLLRDLSALPGDFWIRLLYTHPAHWTDELIATIAACPKVARYVDMPLQHIHEVMLERMRRETSRAHIEDLIRRIRGGIPGIALRTTFIVGFPGETEAMFQELLRFIRETRFERLGVFTYSREDGTIAGRMGGQVPESVRQRRRDAAMAEQHQIARSLAASEVGRELRVLAEGPAEEPQLRAANVFHWEHGFIRETEDARTALGRRRYVVARGEADAPDIDGRVYVRASLPTGEFARVRIVGHTDYDLIAEPL